MLIDLLTMLFSSSKIVFAKFVVETSLTLCPFFEYVVVVLTEGFPSALKFI